MSSDLLELLERCQQSVGVGSTSAAAVPRVGIGAQISQALTQNSEEPDDALLLFLLCQSAVFPDGAVVAEEGKIDFLQEAQTLVPHPSQELLPEDDLQFVKRSVPKFASLRVGQVGFDGLFNRDQIDLLGALRFLPASLQLFSFLP